jgi:hypothetical protein
VARALPFYTKVLGASVEYSDPDFAGGEIGSAAIHAACRPCLRSAPLVSGACAWRMAEAVSEGFSVASSELNAFLKTREEPIPDPGGDDSQNC